MHKHTHTRRIKILIIHSIHTHTTDWQVFFCCCYSCLFVRLFFLTLNQKIEKVDYIFIRQNRKNFFFSIPDRLLSICDALIIIINNKFFFFAPSKIHVKLWAVFNNNDDDDEYSEKKEQKICNANFS